MILGLQQSQKFLVFYNLNYPTPSKEVQVQVSQHGLFPNVHQNHDLQMLLELQKVQWLKLPELKKADGALYKERVPEVKSNLGTISM